MFAITGGVENLAEATRGVDFVLNVSFIEGSGGTINSVVATHGTAEDDTVTITNSNTGFTAVGKYISGWNDVFTFCDAKTSDKEQTPQTVVGAHKMPDGKNLFSLSQDLSAFKYKVYNVDVNYTELVGVPPAVTPVVKQGTITIQHKCHNNEQAIRQFMDNDNYDYNDRR